MPNLSPDAFVVRILGRNGKPVGVGALVGERHIVTCAHVVNAALAIDVRTQAQPTDFVLVDFPLLNNPAEVESSPPRQATIQRWLPPAREGVAGDDFAGLVLDEAAPAGATPALLATNLPPIGRTVRIFGYSGVPPRPDGAWVATTVRGRVGRGRQPASGPAPPPGRDCRAVVSRTTAMNPAEP